MSRMMRVGITGGIGSGKTFVCQHIAGRGYPVYNCDEAAKRLMRESREIRRKLIGLIGADAYDGKGNLNKKAVAQYLFANRENAAHVNAIVHPAVREDFRRWAESQSASFCFMESAILFESGFQTEVDKTVLVYADETTRLQRAMHRDTSTEQQIRERMDSQMPCDEAKKRADYVFDNSGQQPVEEELGKMFLWLENFEC